MKWLMDARRKVAPPRARWRTVLHEVIFEADTPLGKTFDLLLIVSILASVMAVMLDSIGAVQSQYGSVLYRIEWLFTIIFTVEYLFRLMCVDRPLKYAISFYGVADLLAIISTYVSLSCREASTCWSSEFCASSES